MFIKKNYPYAHPWAKEMNPKTCPGAKCAKLEGTYNDKDCSAFCPCELYYAGNCITPDKKHRKKSP